MLVINSTSNNPYFNLAAEEHLLKNFTEDVFLLYRNQPSVIVGKHQNTIAEINLKFAEEHHIKVVRRLSGGGAVYHDLGNVNFTFIRNGVEGKLVDFKGFTKPIIGALAKLGVNANIGGHNSILVDGKKISGNAEHIFKNRVLHHGTLLFSTDLDILAQILYVDQSRFTDRAVKSVRAEVINLSMLISNLNVLEFCDFLVQYVTLTEPKTEFYNFSPSDIQQINHLVDSKYSTWEWNYGYSPSYEFNREIYDPELGSLTLWISVEKGIIVKFNLNGIDRKQLDWLQSHFIGKYHQRKFIASIEANNLIDKELLEKVLLNAF